MPPTNANLSNTVLVTAAKVGEPPTPESIRQGTVWIEVYDRYDFKVQVRHQERDEDASVASLYRDIFTVTLNDFVDVIFIPSFPRNSKNWSFNIADDVEDVRSRHEARQLTAALSDIAVTPDDLRAGQEELIPIPPPPLQSASLQSVEDDMTLESKAAVMFYVTSQEFTRFSQELALIEEHTFLLNEYIPFSEAKDFECIQFILDNIVTSPHFTQEDMNMINLPWYVRFLAPHTVKMNKIERLIPSEYKEKEGSQRVAEELVLQRV